MAQGPGSGAPVATWRLAALGAVPPGWALGAWQMPEPLNLLCSISRGGVCGASRGRQRHQ